jgi:hypothetical protein
VDWLSRIAYWLERDRQYYRPVSNLGSKRASGLNHHAEIIVRMTKLQQTFRRATTCWQHVASGHSDAYPNTGDADDEYGAYHREKNNGVTA